MYMFADDTTLLYSSKNLDDRCINFDIINLTKWINSNSLLLNVKKSELMWFCKPEDDIKINNEALTPSESVKYLGIKLDKCFTFGSHVDSILKKLSKHVFVIAKIRKFVSRSVLFRYYKAYAEPVIRYGLLIYGCTNATKLLPIYKLQKKILGLIYFKKFRESKSHLFSKEFVSVYDLYILELSKFVLGSINQKLPTEFLNTLYKRVEKNYVNTRSKSLNL